MYWCPWFLWRLLQTTDVRVSVVDYTIKYRILISDARLKVFTECSHHYHLGVPFFLLASFPYISHNRLLEGCYFLEATQTVSVSQMMILNYHLQVGSLLPFPLGPLLTLVLSCAFP